jgi:death-on-curing protein
VAHDYLTVAEQIYAEMMRMFESGTFDIGHLEPWLRSFAVAAE